MNTLTNSLLSRVKTLALAALVALGGATMGGAAADAQARVIVNGIVSAPAYRPAPGSRVFYYRGDRAVGAARIGPNAAFFYDGDGDLIRSRDLRRIGPLFGPVAPFALLEGDPVVGGTYVPHIKTRAPLRLGGHPPRPLFGGGRFGRYSGGVGHY